MPLRFTKMHGIGNDFVVLDCRAAPMPLDGAAIRRLGHRRFGVGFDQLLSIEPANDGASAFAYGIWNSDGSTASQCGNGVRCVAAWLAREGALSAGLVSLRSPSGPVRVERLADGRIRVDMGEPQFDPARLPFVTQRMAERYRIDLMGRTIEFGAVSMGNPHALIEVDDIDAAPVDVLGPQLEHAAEFPQRCNVGFAELRSRSAIGLRVWERGVGETLACGSAACAAVAILRQRDCVDECVDVELPGGRLQIHWQGPGHSLWKTGPAAFSFEGVWHE
jgi:diaminopimelate epimerase